MWAAVGQGSICNMPKGYSDQSRGSIATNLRLKSPFQHLQAVYFHLVRLVERNRHPLKLAQEMRDSLRATLAWKWCGEDRGSTWSQRASCAPTWHVILSVPHPFTLHPSMMLKSLLAFDSLINFGLNGAHHGLLNLPSQHSFSSF